ncbi:hypothetical protein MHC_01110 [Mycoplasma haemocanis str. Illinois]|uniref:Uncharacterized protein n=1 Tax=Mycoplasma haemocanis (strain Illinois) TaxID=1111676 RepID=H6N616_MYCHN|nr:hypothetical protein [Mycoplasma haemocanis]AEW45088.1 hypothetical protein MHC_01110 [Mycoplasma haemocanis str. Illinois]
MNSALLTKSTLGILGLGTVTVGTVYFGKNLINNREDKKTMSSIRELIKNSKPHKRLISGDSVSDPFWKAAWKRYRDENLNRDSDSWNLQDWIKPSGSINGDDNSSSHLITACSSKVDLEVEDEKTILFEQVLSYCTRDALVSDLLKERASNKIVLSENSNENEKWKTPWESYKKSGNNKWSLDDWSSQSNKDVAPASFKEACKNKLASKTEETKEGDYEDVLNWCTV